MSQRLAVDDGLLHGHGSAGVQAHNADICGDSPRGHLRPGQNFDHLFFATRGVLGREADNFDRRISRIHRSLYVGNGLGLVVLDPDQDRIGAQNVREDCGSFNQLIGITLHQGVVGGDVGFALRTVDQEKLDGPLGPGG